MRSRLDLRRGRSLLRTNNAGKERRAVDKGCPPHVFVMGGTRLVSVSG